MLLLNLPEIVNWFLANSGSNLEPWAAELRSGKIAKPGEGKPAPGESEPSQPGEGTLFKYFKDSVQGKYTYPYITRFTLYTMYTLYNF